MSRRKFSARNLNLEERRENARKAPLTERRSHRSGGSDGSSMAFLVEVLVLMLLLAGSLAVLVQIFSAAQITARKSEQLEMAVSLASEQAEAFAANPESVEAEATEGDLKASTQVTPQITSAGALYDAHISVSDQTGAVVYELDTSRYVSGGVA